MPPSARPRRAIQDFDQAVQLDGNFAEAFVNRGNIFQSTNKWERALADYGEAVRLKPQDAYSLYSRGLAMRALGREEEAADRYRQGQGDRARHRAMSTGP